MHKTHARILLLAGILWITVADIAAAAERGVGRWHSSFRNATLALVNKSYLILGYLYVSPCGIGHWGLNHLEGAPLAPSRSFTLADIEPGCYDLKVSTPPWFECVIGGARLSGYSTWIITSWTITRSVLGECSDAPSQSISMIARRGGVNAGAREIWRPGGTGAPAMQ
jgi:hypothetical protein